MPKHFDNVSRYLLEFDPTSWANLLGLKTTKAVLYNADLSTVTSQADSILLLGEEQEKAAHVEILSYYDRGVLRRVVLYYALGSRTLERPIKSFLVLLRPDADGPHITGVVRHFDDDGSLILEFHYQVIRIWQIPAEELINGGLGTMPLAFAAKIEPEKLPELVRRAEERIANEATPGEAGDFWTSIGLLMGLKYKKEFWLPLLRGVREMKESSFYQYVVEEGKAIGVEKGKAIGIEEGKAIGEVLGNRKLLLRLGTKNFGPPDAQSKLAIEAIESSEKLEDLFDRCFIVSSWKELLGM